MMRVEGLLQRHRPSVRRRRPGYFRVGRPDQLRYMDMTSVWVADHGWCYLTRSSTAAPERSRPSASTCAAAGRRPRR